MIIQKSINPEGEGMFKVLSKMVNAIIFKTALKVMGKKISENMSSRMYTFSTEEKIRMQY